MKKLFSFMVLGILLSNNIIAQTDKTAELNAEYGYGTHMYYIDLNINDMDSCTETLMAYTDTIQIKDNNEKIFVIVQHENCGFIDNNKQYLKKEIDTNIEDYQVDKSSEQCMTLNLICYNLKNNYYTTYSLVTD